MVSQATLYSDVRKGRRPSWAMAAPGEVAKPLVERFVEELTAMGISVATGRFGEMMELSLVNAGPVTIVFDVSDGRVV